MTPTTIVDTVAEELTAELGRLAAQISDDDAISARIASQRAALDEQLAPHRAFAETLHPLSDSNARLPFHVLHRRITALSNPPAYVTTWLALTDELAKNDQGLRLREDTHYHHANHTREAFAAAIAARAALRGETP